MRTVVAIRIDEVEIVIKHPGGSIVTRTLSQRDAEREGWFYGPPYAVAEYVFDEDSLEGCSLRDQ